MKPITGDIAAARHLLRHLHNPRALSHNPLVARLFEPKRSANDAPVMLRVRDIVGNAIQGLKAGPNYDVRAAHSARQHAIITRYDVAGESLAIIANDLHIRTSKFYYERRAALGRLAQFVHCIVSAESAASNSDATNVQVRSAAALEDVGQSDLALAVLRGLIKEAPSAIQRALASCRLVKVLCDLGKIQEASEALEIAHRAASELGFSDGEAGLLAGELEFATLRIAIDKGKTAEALDIGSRSCASLRNLCDSSGSEPATILLVSMLCQLGSLKSNCGMVTDAAADFQEGLKRIAPYPGAEKVRGSLLTNLAFAQAIMGGGFRAALKTNAEALHLATKNGLLRSVVEAHVNESQFQYWAGNTQAAWMHSRIAQPIANALCDPREKSRVSLIHARVEALCNHERDALRRIRSARVVLPRDSYLAILSYIIESQILSRLNAPAGAIRAADIAAKRSERISSHRGTGMAALLKAQAFEAQGEKSKAIAAVNLSIAHLEKSAGLFPLAQAFQCSARLTGSRRHRSNALDLLMSFRAH